jgi:DNA-binding MarR family transcriptional regulator
MGVDVETALAQHAGVQPGLETPVDVVPSVRELGHALARQRLSAGQAAFSAGPTEMSALEWLYLEERTPTQLAERLQLTTASVTGLVDRLAAQHLVDRHPHPRDRRKILVALTDDARVRLADLFARFSAATTRAIEHLKPSERHQLVDSLERITAELSADAAALAGPALPQVDEHHLADTLNRITAATTAFSRSRRPDAPGGDADGARPATD